MAYTLMCKPKKSSIDKKKSQPKNHPNGEKIPDYKRISK